MSGQLQGQEITKLQGFLSAVMNEEKLALEKKLKHIKKDFLMDVISYLLGNLDPKTVNGLVGKVREDQDVLEGDDAELVESQLQSQLQSQSQSQSQNTENTIKTTKDKSKVCSFYLKGVCRHGKAGKECQFHHPKICFKFKKEGKDGCQRGKRCQFAHVTFCKRDGCQDKDCKYGYHLDKKTQNSIHRAYQGSSPFSLPRLETKREEIGMQSQDSTQNFLDGLQRILHQTITEAMRSFLGNHNQF